MRLIQRIALYLYFFSVNFEIWDPLQTEGSLSVSKLIGFFYLAVMIPKIISFKTKAESKFILLPLVLFFALITLVNLFNINSTINNFFDMTLFQNIILLYILINHESHDRFILEKGMLSFAFGSIAISILFIAGIGIEYSSNGRLTLFGANENAVGMRMCISSIILILSVIQNPLQIGKIRLLLLLPIPLMIQLQALTASRVSMLALILAFLSGSFLVLRKKDLLSKTVMLAVAMLFLIFVLQFFMQFEVLKLRLLSSIKEGDLGGRDVIWQAIMPLIKENPIFGVGTIGYESYSINTFGRFTSPHNVILEILCYTGITGLIIYSLFLYRLFLNSLLVFRRKNLLLPILLTIPIMGLIVSGQIIHIKTGWIVFSYIAGCSIINKSSEPAYSIDSQSIKEDEYSLCNK
jgi:O-antigen ligase